MEDHRYGRYAPIPTATLRSAQRSAMELAGLRVADHDLWQGVRNRWLRRQKLNCLNTLIGILLHKFGDYFRQVFMGLRPTEWWLVTGTSKMGLSKVCDLSSFAKTGHYCINSIMIIYQDGCWTKHRDKPWNVGFAPAIMIIDDCLPTSWGRTPISQRRLQWSVKGMSMWTSTSIGFFRHAADRYISWLMIIILLWGWTNDQWSMRSWTNPILQPRRSQPIGWWTDLFRVFWNASSQKIWFGHDCVP